MNLIQFYKMYDQFLNYLISHKKHELLKEYNDNKELTYYGYFKNLYLKGEGSNDIK